MNIVVDKKVDMKCPEHNLLSQLMTPQLDLDSPHFLSQLLLHSQPIATSCQKLLKLKHLSVHWWN
jgi:hypothetical protein